MQGAAPGELAGVGVGEGGCAGVGERAEATKAGPCHGQGRRTRWARLGRASWPARLGHATIGAGGRAGASRREGPPSRGERAEEGAALGRSRRGDGAVAVRTRAGHHGQANAGKREGITSGQGRRSGAEGRRERAHRGRGRTASGDGRARAGAGELREVGERGDCA
jgi:hypothetical protein